MLLSRCVRLHRSRRGLTLLELIVALGILAALSTIAVRAIDPLADQSRYEATQRLLDDLRDATVGSALARQINGQPIVSGYLADTGSLPTNVSDFLSMPAGLIAHQIQSFDSDRDSINDVILASGWNGPYVLRGAGQTELLDGWGRPPLIGSDGGEFALVSLGCDNDSVLPEDGYQADLKATIPASRFSSSATFRLFAIDGNTNTRIDPSPSGLQRLGILLYAVNANGGTSGAMEEVTLNVDGSFEASQNAMIHGPAAARGILWSDTNSDGQLDSGEPISLRSFVHHFMVTGDANLRIEMELR